MFGEVGGVEGVFAFAEVEVDGDAKGFFGGDFFEACWWGSGGDAAFDGEEAVVVDVHKFFFEFASGVAEGGHKAAPVGIAAEPRGFDEEARGNGAGSLAGLHVVGCAFDGDFNAFGDAFAVEDDGLGHFGAAVEKGGFEFGEVRVVGAEGVVACAAVGEAQDGVVGGHVAVHEDAVEGEFDGFLKAGGESAAEDGGVGGDEAKHRGHVGINHTGAFGADADGDGEAVDAHLDGGVLGPCVAGHNSVREVEPGVGGEFGDGFADTFTYGRHWERAADATGGADEHFGVFASEGEGGEAGGFFGVSNALDTGAGVGVAAVGGDGTDAPAGGFEVGDADLDWCGFDAACGECACCNGWKFADDQTKVFFGGAGFDANIEAAGTETWHGGHCAGGEDAIWFGGCHWGKPSDSGHPRMIFKH